MNKSKFLKKSLAMLLALMLVVAMIPLSASAASTDYIVDLYVNGEKAGNTGADSFKVTVQSTTIGISAAVDNGAVLYYATEEGDEDGEPIKGATIDLTDCEEVAKDQYLVYILAKVKENPETDDYKTVETYPLTVTVAQAPELNDDASMMGLAKDDPTWDHMTSYAIDNDAQTIVVTFEFGYTGAEQSDLQPADFAATDYENAEVEVENPTVAGSVANVKVTAQDGSVNNYALYYEYEGAFESFTIPEQIGETEFVYGGQYVNQININVPYGYLDGIEDVIPTFELMEGYDHLFINANPTKEVISGVTKVALTANGDAKAKAELSMDLGNGHWVGITLNITAVSKNPSALLEKIVVGQDGTGLSSNETVLREGSNEVELPAGTTIANKTYAVTVTGAKNATVVLTDCNVNAPKTEVLKNGKFTFNGVAVNEGQSFSLQVTSEDGKATAEYLIVLKSAAKSEAKLNNVVLKDAKTGEYYEATVSLNSGAKSGEAVITVPYSWSNKSNTSNVVVYMTPSTGASIVDPSRNDEAWRFNGAPTEKDEWQSYNRLVINGWMPAVDNKDGKVFKVVSSDGKDFNTYTLKIVSEDGKTARTIESVEMVGTGNTWEITESNTYKTEIGEGTLDGNTVRTIEVTVPFSFGKEGQPNKGYFNDLTLSDGSKAYYTISAKPNEIITVSPNATAQGFDIGAYENGKDANGNIDLNKALPVYVLSEEENVKLSSSTNMSTTYKDGDNASIYYLVVKRAAPEKGNSLLSIESTLDKNVTATLESKTITITVPSSYVGSWSNATPFSLNFEVSKLATVTAEGVEIKSDLGSPEVDATDFIVYEGKLRNKSANTAPSGTGDGVIEQFVVTSEDGDSQTYAIKVEVAKAQTSATISALSVNGTAATIARDKIHVQLPLGTQLYPVSLDITASKMATVEIDGAKYDPNERYDVNDEVKITVTSEDGNTVNTYTLTASVAEGFEDVNTGDWFYGEVMTAANAGWVNGMEPGKFEPLGKLTRAQFATIVARILGCDTDATVESMFPDCNETDWFNAAVTFCVKRGIIAGDDKGYFNPNEPITREQMAKILCEAAGVEQVTDPEKTYDDDAKIADWAKDYVYACQEAGVMEGDNGSFRPKDNATRAEAATVLVRAFA